MEDTGDNLFYQAVAFKCFGQHTRKFGPDDIAALQSHDWPGNVRQLRNVVHGAKAAAGDGKIGAGHLSLHASGWASRAASEGATASGLPRGMTLRELERRAIEQALEDCDGNRTRAAKMLDIDRSTLRRKLIEFELN